MSTTLLHRSTYFQLRDAQRQGRARLAAELASYRTAGERMELDAILARHSDADSAPVRELLY
jgi:hypothetical protein